MHENRITHTLPSYQAKLRRNYMNLGILIYNQSLEKAIIIRPIPASVWLEESRPRYFKKLQLKAKYINKSKHFTFCTLTYSNKRYSPIEAAKRVKHDIDLFFKRLDYRNSKPEYFYVIELTDNMMVHIHLIFDRYVHKSKLWMSWFKVTGSISIKIKHKALGAAIDYCLKYLRKSQNQSVEKWAFIFKNVDRIWTSSRKFFGTVKNDPSEWKFLVMAWDKSSIVSNKFNSSDQSKSDHNFSPEEAYFYVDDCFYNECVISTGTTEIFRELKSFFEIIPF